MKKYNLKTSVNTRGLVCVSLLLLVSLRLFAQTPIPEGGIYSDKSWSSPIPLSFDGQDDDVKLSSRLSQLYQLHLEGESKKEYAEKANLKLSEDDHVAVTIYAEAGSTTDKIDKAALKQLGVIMESQSRQSIKARIPVSQLKNAGTKVAGIGNIRQSSATRTVVAPGVSASKLDSMIKEGHPTVDDLKYARVESPKRWMDKAGSRKPVRNLPDSFNDLYQRYKQGENSKQYARQHAIDLAEDRVEATILPATGLTVEAIDVRALSDSDVIIKATTQYGLLVEIPIDKLEAVATMLEGTAVIRQPLKPHVNAITSEGVGLMDADRWQTAGYKGAGVKIAIIDAGFEGLAAAQANGDIPAAYDTVDFTGTSSMAGTEHGTAVAEAAYDLAPQAQYYFLKINNEIDLALAKNYCIANGIDIVNMSLGFFNAGGYYDGTGLICDIAQDAIDRGILWVNSAGNSANDHYRATFSDTNANPYHNFDATFDFNPIVIPGTDILYRHQPGDPVSILLNWNNYPTTDQDYALVLFGSNDGASWVIAAVSNNPQDGTTAPEESITGFATHPYHAVGVLKVSATADADFTLFNLGLGDIRFKTNSSSIADPASVTDVITVGAIDRNNYFSGPQQSFSSQGPTNDGRNKPDITAPDNCNSFTYGRWNGTSLAAPHVAGAIAQIKSRFPAYTDAQVKSYLLTNSTLDLGTPGLDNVYGYGALSLPAPGSDFPGCDVSACTGPDCIVVANGNDSGPGSLRQAIADIPGGGTIMFANGVSKIGLTSNLLSINKSLTIDGCQGVTITRTSGSFRIMNIRGNITVNMNDLTIQNGDASSYSGANSSGAAFWNQNGAILNMTRCVVRNNGGGERSGAINGYKATLNMDSCELINNTSLGQASGMLNQDGVANITNSIISGNVAAGDVEGGGASGGGILSFPAHTAYTELNLSHCLVENNTAYKGSGGGIAVMNGFGSDKVSIASVSHTSILNNIAGGGGGLMVAHERTTVTIDSSFINRNISSDGGGLLIFTNATATVNHSEINHNLALRVGQDTISGGGGVFVYRDSATVMLNQCKLIGNQALGNQAAGGGLINVGGNARLTNCLVHDNIAFNEGFGGGVASFASRKVDTVAMDTTYYDAYLELVNNTIANNIGEHNNGILVANFDEEKTVAQMIIQNTITYNPTGLGTDYSNCDTDPVIINRGGNIASDTTMDHFFTIGDRGSTDPLFVDIASRNYRLRACSPAVNLGNPAGAPAFDMEGIARVGVPDAGVHEFTGEDCATNPFSFVPPTTSNISNAMFGMATVSDLPTSSGDWIAAFDDEGNCVGADSLLHGVNPGCDPAKQGYIILNIYGDYSGTPSIDEGLDPGDYFTLQLYDASENAYLVYAGDGTDDQVGPANFDGPIGTPMPGLNDFCTAYNFEEPAGSTVLALDAGWNLISLGHIPELSPVEFVEGLLKPNNLEFMSGFNGRALSYDPTIPAFLNTLKTLDQTLGYWVKLTEKDTIRILGVTAEVDILGNLNAGWNLISYLERVPKTPQNYFAPLISAGNLDWVSGYEDAPKTFDPAKPPFLNTLDSLRPGYGYWVKVQHATAPDPSPAAGGRMSGAEAMPFAFTPTNQVSRIYGQITVDGIPAKAGSWVAAFDAEGHCAGAEEVIVQNGVAYMNLAIFGDDYLTAGTDEGMTSAEGFTLKLYNAATELYLNATDTLSGWANTNGAPIANYNDPNTVYNFSGTSLDTEMALQVGIAPNPSKGLVEVEVNLPTPASLEVEITTMTGEQIFREVRENPERNYSKTINLKSYDAGIYLVKVIVPNQQPVIRKIVLLD